MTWDATRNVVSADAPYPEGADFTVLYLPEDPSFSRPGADPAVPRGEATGNRRFTRKLLLGIFAFFVLNAVLCAVKLRRLRSQGMPVNGFLISPEWTGRLLALLFLAILLGTNFTGNAPEFYRRAFGATPLGAPVLVVVSVVQAVLFVPYFWVWPHLMRIAFQAVRDRASLSGANLMHYILVAPGRHPELRYSRTVALAGLGYFALLMGAWIAYTAYRGI